MSKILAHGDETADGRYILQHGDPKSAPDTVMKTEEESKSEVASCKGGDQSSHTTDVAMREMSDAQTEEHAEQDARMATIQEQPDGDSAPAEKED